VAAVAVQALQRQVLHHALAAAGADGQPRDVVRALHHEREIAADGAAHAQRIPVAAGRDARGIGGDGEIERVARIGLLIALVLRAEDAVIVRRAATIM
jgi:hypothetical protein